MSQGLARAVASLVATAAVTAVGGENTVSADTEIWKDVVGYEGVYQVSDQGRVKRIKATYGARVGRIMSLATSWGPGYLTVCLWENNAGKTHYVHHLVAEAFLGPRPSGYAINHKDGMRQNNRPNNLEYLSPKNHVLHTFTVLHERLNPTWLDNRGERNVFAKLEPEQVLRIRELHALGECSPRQLREQYNVSRQTISRILERLTWTHI